MIRVAIAEDHQAMADGINLLLKYEENISIVGTAGDGQTLLDIVRHKRPHVVLTDIKMPKIDGFQATKTIKKEFPEIKVIAFSMLEKDANIAKMIDAGVSGYLLKNSPLEEVLNAITCVAGGGQFFDSNIDHERIKESSKRTKEKPLLSKSEREILQLIGDGKSTSEIANLRFSAVSTVETHRKNMIRKLGLSGKSELLRYAIEVKYDE